MYRRALNTYKLDEDEVENEVSSSTTSDPEQDEEDVRDDGSFFESEQSCKPVATNLIGKIKEGAKRPSIRKKSSPAKVIG